SSQWRTQKTPRPSNGRANPWDLHSNRNMIYYMVAAVAATLLSLMMLLAKTNNAAKGNMQILLATSPSSVMINVDGKALDNGAYIDTPRRFSLPPGPHEMIVHR